MRQATLRLFNAIPVGFDQDKGTGKSKADSKRDSDRNCNREAKQDHAAFLDRCIRHGYVLDPAINPTSAMLDDIEAVIGISGEKANAAFHKSWKVIQESSIESLVIQQIIHYMTTYGFEALGIYREDAVYIPNEVLEIPEPIDSLPLIVVKAINQDELLAGIQRLGSGIALAEQTLNDIMSVVEQGDFDSSFSHDIKNRELKTRLHDHYGIVPSEPTAFLRHLVSKLTDESLLIKNAAMIEKIKSANGKFLDVLLKDAPSDLASIFLRYKPLFLAMKSISHNKRFFNVLRKQARTAHQPLPTDYLNDVTAQIKRGALDQDYLKKRIGKAPIFRKIRLAYALQHRLHADDATVFRIRNGRGWATSFQWSTNLLAPTQAALDTVLASIADAIRPNVEGRTIYIPQHIHYALPATEKQFTGHLPSGTSVSVPNDMIVGIHWKNTNHRVDLDLSVVRKSGKIGWDAQYRSDSCDVLFSGDVTDAPGPKGASELFYLKQAQDEPAILMANYFNHQKDSPVPTKLLVTHESPKNFENNYMVDVNNIVASANLNVTRKQNVLGLIANVENEMRFYFANISIGNSISSGENEVAKQTRKYLVSQMVQSLDFRNVLRDAGATIVAEKPEGDHVDLSPESLNKSTIIDLIQAS